MKKPKKRRTPKITKSSLSKQKVPRLGLIHFNDAQLDKPEEM